MNQFHKRFAVSKTASDTKWFVVLFLLVVAIGIIGCASTSATPPSPANSPVPTTGMSTEATLALPTAPAAGTPVNTTAAAEPTSAQSGAPTENAAPSTATTAAAVPPTAAPTPDTQHPLARPDMTIRKVATVGTSNVKIARNPLDGEAYYLHSNDGVFHVDLKTGDTKRVVALTEIVTNGVAAGMTFEADGTLLVVVNQNVMPKYNQAVIRRGTPNEGGTWAWDTLAETEPYPLAGNNFDHLYNGVVVSPDGKYVFVNAGSRSDHGEVEDNLGTFPGLREVPLTSAIFRIPADAQDLVLPADETALKPYLYADGTRNSFDPEFAPNGDLIAGDNGPDADFPDELNWIQQGHHYGFPWKFGTQDNPQRSPDYTGLGDPYLQSGFFAVDNGFYHNDKTFPPPPDGVTFTDPIVNLGPDAAHYRGADGSEHDAFAEGKTLSTFTPHRSPLGLAFVTGNKMPADLRSTDTTLSAFITGWGAAAGTLSDRGADLLHLELTKKGDHYEMTTHQVAKGFNYPVSGLLIGNHYYLLEWGENGAIWEITF